MASNVSIDAANAEIANAITGTGNTFVFEWKLDANVFKKSIFEKKKMIEKVDIRKVYGFIKNNMGIKYPNEKRYKDIKKLYADELEWMKNYKSIYDKKAKVFKTSYRLANHKWGRINPENYLSLCIAHRPTRHSLANDEYEDIDMINAHPVIMYEISKHHNLDVNNLKKYCEDREAILQEISTHHQVNREVAKNLPLVLSYGGSYAGWKKDKNVSTGDNLEFIVNLENDFRIIRALVYQNNKHIEEAVLQQNPQK
jgi:hypothetical protein